MENAEKRIHIRPNGEIVPEDQWTEIDRWEYEELEKIRQEDGDYEEEYVSIDDIARGEGFWIDDDGHWQELPDDYDW